jgi:hypothetical protein
LSIIHTTDDHAVEQLPIEQIEPGDFIIATSADGGRGGQRPGWRFCTPEGSLCLAGLAHR